MNKHLIAAALAFAACAAHAEAEYKPFVMFDYGQERDEKHDDVARDYINANVTVGVKGPNKMEYSIKGGLSQSNPTDSTSKTTSNNIEFKVKKSYQLTDWAQPYVSLRLGEKIKYDGKHFTHYAVDGGVKFKLAQNLAFDTGVRYRNSLSKADFEKYEGSSGEGYSYQSVRYHGMLLFDVDKSNTVGLRYTRSNADYYKEEREGWRVHYQRNY
jgi:opacity protein-like surface antigen